MELNDIITILKQVYSKCLFDITADVLRADLMKKKTMS